MQTDLYPAGTVAAESPFSGVAWAAIIGGALAAVGLSLILTPLGSAFGLAGMEWHHGAGEGKAMTVAGAIWIICVQWLSSGLGGYMTGRLRKKWTGAHTHEIFFRDTMHGFLAWALASVAGAIFLASLMSHVAGHVMHRGANGAPEAYYTDSLFRTDQANASVTEQDRIEAGHILAMGGITGDVTSSDKNYLSRLVAVRTGMAAPDADARVDTVLGEQKAAMEAAQKATAKASLFISLSLLIGAFIASAAAALGGRDRDFHYETGRLNP